LLEINEVTKIFNQGSVNEKVALKDVSLKVPEGDFITIIGGNGAGKSTLLLALAGILRAEGSILVEGIPLSQSSLPRLRARLGLVFQSPEDQLFSPTVFEDVAYAPLYQGLTPAEITARASEALAAVGMQAFAARMPHHLSMGEKKRVAIATVLAMRPAMLLFDEPSAGLDPRARRELIHLLEQLPQTLLIATHDLNLVQHICPRMVILDEGRLVADGKTEQLLADEGLLAAHGLA